jgi:hypothetical protein
MRPEPAIQTRANEKRGGFKMTAEKATPGRRRLGWWSLLLLVQFVGVLWPPFFNRVEPSWLDIPFFYWYQLVWVLIGAGCTSIVYLATDD